jgi:protein-L-isoaspartate O-methyltransferase
MLPKCGPVREITEDVARAYTVLVAHYIQGVADEPVLNAMRVVPRHLFVPKERQGEVRTKSLYPVSFVPLTGALR